MNLRRFVFVVFVWALATSVLHTPAAAQVEITARGASIRVGGRVQAQLVTSSTDAGPSTDFLIRRTWLTLDAKVSQWISGRVQYDVQGSLKDAYVRFSASPRLQVDMGHFKRAFDPFFLASSADITVIERDGRIPGLGATAGGPAGCPGVGNVCTLGRLTKGLDYNDRDVGLRVTGAVGPRFTYQATLTNGTGTGTDENGAKSVAARGVVLLPGGARVGADMSVHDYLFAQGDTRYASAWGADVEVGSFEKQGNHLQAGVEVGDNWKAEPAGSSPTFLALEAILSRYTPTGSSGPFQAVEPLARISWADPETNVGGDGGLLLTPGVNVYFARRNRIEADVDVYAPHSGPTSWSLKVQSALYF